MAELPAEISSKAFIASNGELAWRREEVESAISAIRDSGCAILGGEIWLITGPGSWTSREFGAGKQNPGLMQRHPLGCCVCRSRWPGVHSDFRLRIVSRPLEFAATMPPGRSWYTKR